MTSYRRYLRQSCGERGLFIASVQTAFSLKLRMCLKMRIQVADLPQPLKLAKWDVIFEVVANRPVVL